MIPIPYDMLSVLYELQNLIYLSRHGKVNTMKLTVFGATGATGTSLVTQALAAGHEVTAVVRDPARLAVPESPRLRNVPAELMDPAPIRPAAAAPDPVP